MCILSAFTIIMHVLSTRIAVASWFFIVYLTYFNPLIGIGFYTSLIVSSHFHLSLSIPCSLLLFGSCYFIHVQSRTKSHIPHVVCVPAGKSLSLTTKLLKFLDLKSVTNIDMTNYLTIDLSLSYHFWFHIYYIFYNFQDGFPFLKYIFSTFLN